MSALRDMLMTQVKELYDLPHLPMIAAQVIRKAQDPESSARDLGDLIQQDTALSARVLRVANSSLFALRSPVVSVDRAVVVLGAQMISSIVLGECLNAEFEGRIPRETLMAYWQHSWSAASAAQEMAGWLPSIRPGTLLTLGLLHDIGVLALLALAHDEACEAWELAAGQGMDPVEAELEVMGTTHPEVGGWLAEAWRLPEAIHVVARFHHAPVVAPEEHQPSAAVAYLSNYVANVAGAVRFEGLTVPDFWEDSLALMRPSDPLPRSLVVDLAEDIASRQEGISALLRD